MCANTSAAAVRIHKHIGIYGHDGSTRREHNNNIMCKRTKKIIIIINIIPVLK